MNVEMALCLDKTPRYYITHESANESLVLTEKEAEDLYNHLHMILHKGPEEPKDKLIIHEIDCHGCGNIYYKGVEKSYSYDDGEFGDVRRTVDALIDLGFINPDNVVIFDDSQDKSIYTFVERGLAK